MIPHYHFKTIRSTNTYAKQFAKSLSSIGAVFTADEQTNGRGRGSHQWYSAPKAGLYYSLLIPAPMAYKELHSLTQKIGHLTINGITHLTGIRPTLEWPNDIILNHKKLGGILIESVGGANQKSPRYVVIGIGLNLNHTKFADHLQVSATSLCLETKAHYDTEPFIQHLTQTIMTDLFGDYSGLLPPKT
jgi:BirA family biotin operon repressor/biotin-[acetyl-CoA-carboxylase] ligase